VPYAVLDQSRSAASPSCWRIDGTGVRARSYAHLAAADRRDDRCRKGLLVLSTADFATVWRPASPRRCS
jgi:hypothetical protein